MWSLKAEKLNVCKNLWLEYTLLMWENEMSIKKIFVLKSEYLFLNILRTVLSSTVAIKFKLNIK